MEKKKYTQLSESERYELYRLHMENKSIRWIAEQLGRSASTISRELRRNAIYVGYLPREAGELAKQRCYKSMKKLDKYPELRIKLLEGLNKRWSPKVIAGRLIMEKNELKLCQETIYSYIYDSAFGRKHELTQFLCRHKPRRTKKKTRKTRIKIPNRVSIHERPEEINTREKYP
jgi:IS30 family transposase